MITLPQKITCFVAAATAGAAALAVAINNPHPSWLPNWLVAPLGLVSAVLLFFAAFLVLWILSDIAIRFLVPKEFRGIPLFMWEWHVSARRGLHFTAGGVIPIRRLIPLRRAAQKAYPKMRTVSPLNLGIIAAEENNHNKVLRIVAQMLLDSSDLKIPLYGVRLPSEEFANISKVDLDDLGVSDDAMSLCVQFQKGFDNSEVVRYTKLAIRSCDLNRFFKENGL
jgi:hypothetical protein